jgi:rod shape-determining protein MreC
MRNLSFYKNKPLITLLILLVLSVALMFLNTRIKSFNIRSVFFFITYPIEYGISAVGDFFHNTVTGISKRRELEAELDIAMERLRRYQERLLLYSQVINENERLKRILDIKESIDYETLYARIVFRDPTFLGDFFIIDKGRRDDITENMAVVSHNEDGELYLVGKTTEVGFSASKVKLITARNFYLGVSLKNTGYVGLLSGLGSWHQNCEVDYIPIEANTYIGESVITSGESETFPYGIKVGRVVGIGKSVMEEFFQKLYIKPEYSYSKTKDVFIIRWEPSAEIGSLLEGAYEQ